MANLVNRRDHEDANRQYRPTVPAEEAARKRRRRAQRPDRAAGAAVPSPKAQRAS